MRLPVILEISATHLRSRPKQSVTSALGVTFGIAMFIVLVSFMTGLNGLLDGLILNRTPHVRLYNEISIAEDQPVELSERYKDNLHLIRSVKPQQNLEKIHNSLAIMALLRQDARVLDVAPRVTAQVFYHAGNIEINGLVNGVDVLAENRMFLLNDYLIDGDVRDMLTINDGIILGKGVADKLLVEPGDRIQVTSAQGNRLSLQVVGFYQSGLAEVDDIQSYTTLKTAQKLLGRANDYITDINVNLTDMATAPAFGREMEALFDLEARDIQTANAQYETGSSIRNLITYAVSITLLLVAGFGIYNILNMMIYEKMDDIAILKAVGFSGGDVRLIFISQALLTGLAGGAVGLLVGYLLSALIDRTPFETQALPSITTYPVNFDPKFYAIGVAFALVTTFLAGWLPARKAAGIDPVDIIRGK